MLVRLNAWRGDDGPGEIVDLDDTDAAVLIHHGAAFAVDDIDLELDKAAKATGKVVKGAATLIQASDVVHGTT